MSYAVRVEESILTATPKETRNLRSFKSACILKKKKKKKSNKTEKTTGHGSIRGLALFSALAHSLIAAKLRTRIFLLPKYRMIDESRDQWSCVDNISFRFHVLAIEPKNRANHLISADIITTARNAIDRGHIAWP